MSSPSSGACILNGIFIESWPLTSIFGSFKAINVGSDAYILKEVASPSFNFSVIFYSIKASLNNHTRIKFLPFDSSALVAHSDSTTSLQGRYATQSPAKTSEDSSEHPCLSISNCHELEIITLLYL